MSQIQKYIP